MNKNTLPITISTPIVTSGIWWLLSALFTFSRLGNHRGPPLPRKLGGKKPSDGSSSPRKSCVNPFSVIAQSFLFGVKTSYKSLILLTNFCDLSLFIMALIFLDDASTTTVSAAAVIATSVLNISSLFVAVSAGIGFVGAAVGLLVWGFIVKKRWLRPKHVMGINLVTFLGCLVWIEFMRELWELFVISFIAGFNAGSYGAFGMSIFFSMVPPLYDARFYSFKEFSTKTTTWIAPLIVASITTAVGEKWLKEVTLVTIGVEIVIGSVFLFICNVPRGEKFALQEQNDEDVGGCCKCVEETV